MAIVKEALVNCGGRGPATTETTAGALRLPSRSAATTVSRYSLSRCSGRPVVRTWPVFLSTSKRPSPPARGVFDKMWKVNASKTRYANEDNTQQPINQWEDCRATSLCSFEKLSGAQRWFKSIIIRPSSKTYSTY